MICRLPDTTGHHFMVAHCRSDNSMSPKMQLELKTMLEEMAGYCGCQLVIATHSPFLLSLDGAMIYDLDASPVDIKNWWELENARVYFDFFKQNEALFR